MIRNFDIGLFFGATVAGVAIAVAVFRATRVDSADRRMTVLRTLAIGSIASVFVASVATRGGLVFGYHQLVLGLGGGGLDRVSVVVSDPMSSEALQLLFNVLAYVPIGLLVGLAWNGRPGPWRGVAAAFATSLAVEFAQWQFTTRVAATDDVVLNVIGGGIGALLAAAFGRRTTPST